MLGSLASATLTSSFFFVSDSGAFDGGVFQLSLPSQDFAIHRHQGPPIHNDSSSLVDLSVKSYTVLMKEMQEESGP